MAGPPRDPAPALFAHGRSDIPAARWGAGDAIAGISTGILARTAVALPPDQRAPLTSAIATIFRDDAKNLVFAVGIYGCVAALVTAAAALLHAGAPRLPLVLLAPSAYFLMGDHRAPYGPLAFGFFFLAATWIELAQRRASHVQRVATPAEDARPARGA